MKIAILTSGILPVPAVKGGAVENLTDFYLAYNDRHHLHDITVYSVGDQATRHHPALQSEVNHYHFVEVQSLLAKVRKRLYHWLHGEGYYHYTIEYFFQQAMRHIRHQGYDMVILENRPGYGLQIPKDLQAKVVLHLHNDFLHADTKGARDIYDRMDGIVCISDFIRQRVATINSDSDRKCVTVLNGIDVEAFSQSHTKDRRRTAGLQDSDFVVVFSGRIVEEKGIRQLLTAMQELKDRKDIKLLIVGGSFYGNERRETAFIRELRELATDIRDQIVFTGFRPYSEMPSLLAQADIAVLPSVWDEPLGLTCIEAMATGLPIITTRKGGIPETVTPACAIMLDVDEQLPHHIATAILDLYDHPEKRQAMGRAAIEQAQTFSKERYAERFFQALKSF